MLGSVDRLQLRDAEAAVHARDRLDHEARVRRRAAVLVDDDVRLLLRDEHVPRPRVELQRDLVRHRRGRHEERRLLPEERRGALLEEVDGRVLAPLLVADVRGGDRRTHPVRRPRGGVRTKIDHGRHPTGRPRHGQPRPSAPACSCTAPSPWIPTSNS